MAEQWPTASLKPSTQQGPLAPPAAKPSGGAMDPQLPLNHTRRASLPSLLLLSHLLLVSAGVRGNSLALMPSNQLTFNHASRTGSSMLCSQGVECVPVWQSLQPVRGKDSSVALRLSGLTHQHLLHQVTVLSRRGAGPALLSVPASEGQARLSFSHALQASSPNNHR